MISRLAVTSFQILLLCLDVESSQKFKVFSSNQHDVRMTKATTTTTTTTKYYQSYHGRQLAALPVGVTDCEDYFGRTALKKISAEPDYVSLADPQNNFFCMNGGFCKTTYKTHPEDPCVCVEGFAGPHCEFNGTEADVPKNCTLQCMNGGTCQIGALSWQEALHFSYVHTPADQMQYCACPVGFSGNLCDFDAHDYSNITCVNNQTCLHGGQCVTIYDGSNTITNHCDCTNANDDGILHAGANCENEATTICSDDHNGRQFCVNGGTCKSDSHLGCNCPDGFVGPICEFVDLHIPPSVCALQCMNQGICRKGAKDVSNLTKWGIFNRRRLQETSSNVSLILNETIHSTFNQDFEHCVCPIGYVGLQCEHKLDICPGGDHACLNGGLCRTSLKDGQIEFVCDCNDAVSNSHRYAGEFCEMESTDFCTINGEMPSGGPASLAFCTNGGICRSRVHVNETHPGCYCPDGYSGENCQYVTDTTTPDNQVNHKKYDIMMWTFIGAGLCFLVIGVILLNRDRRLRSKSQFYNMDQNISPHGNEDMTFEASNVHSKPFEGNDFDYGNDSATSDSNSCTSSNASRSSRKSKHLKRPKKKRFSTYSSSNASTDGQTTNSNESGSGSKIRSYATDKDGVIKPSKGQWPNAKRNAIDTAAIFNEIDLGDDYGVNLVV